MVGEESEKISVCKGSDAEQSLQTAKQQWPDDGGGTVKLFSYVARSHIRLYWRIVTSLCDKLAPGVWISVETRLLDLATVHLLDSKGG